MKFSYCLLILLIIGSFEPSFGQSNSLLLNQTMVVGNANREYHLFLPDTTLDAPIVLLFHGHSNNSDGLLELDSNGVSDPSIVAPYKKWLEIAQQENIILAVPNGYNIGDTLKGWNDCRSDAYGNSEEDDVLFTGQLIDYLISTYQAEPGRVYANGTSNGGHFCIRLAEEIPEKIAAFAAIVSSNAVNSECATGSLPVSAMFINGTGDPLCPYNGGQMPDNRGEVYSTANTISYWIQRNSTDTTPAVTPIPDLSSNDNCTLTKYEFNNGAGNTCVVLYRVDDGGHTDPSQTERYSPPAVPFIFGKQNGDIEMAQEAWNFFKGKVKPITSIDEPHAELSFHIYPNPARGHIKIDCHPNSEIEKIDLLNLMGATVRDYCKESDEFDLVGLPAGIYFLRIKAEGTFIVQKVVKR